MLLSIPMKLCLLTFTKIAASNQGMFDCKQTLNFILPLGKPLHALQLSGTLPWKKQDVMIKLEMCLIMGYN